MTSKMNAPRAEANKSIAEVEKTAVSLSGILTGYYCLVTVRQLTAWMAFMFNAVFRGIINIPKTVFNL